MFQMKSLAARRQLLALNAGPLHRRMLQLRRRDLSDQRQRLRRRAGTTLCCAFAQTILRMALSAITWSPTLRAPPECLVGMGQKNGGGRGKKFSLLQKKFKFCPDLERPVPQCMRGCRRGPYVVPEWIPVRAATPWAARDAEPVAAPVAEPDEAMAAILPSPPATPTPLSPWRMVGANHFLAVCLTHVQANGVPGALHAEENSGSLAPPTSSGNALGRRVHHLHGQGKRRGGD